MHAGRAALQHRKGFWSLGARNAKVISAARDLGVESRFDLAQVFVQRTHKHREFAGRRLKDVDKIFQVFFHIPTVVRPVRPPRYADTPQ